MVTSAIVFVIALITVGLVGVQDIEGEESVDENKVEEVSAVEVSKSSVIYELPEVDPTLLDSPFPADMDTPLTYIETRELLLDMREEKLEEFRYEREQAILAHLEAMEEIKAEKEAEAERVAKEKAEEEARVEAEKAEAERVAKEKEAEQKAEAETEVASVPAEKEEQKVQTSSTNKEQGEVKSEPVEKKENNNSNSANSLLLAKLVESEAKGEPYEGKVAVAEVVLARVNSSQFPNSIEGVIYQKGQFQVVSNGSINNEPSQESINASNEALAGSNYSNGALFFYNPRIATDRWQDSLTTTTVIGNHTFKK